jgi:DNA-binding response OmpR family regulator
MDVPSEAEMRGSETILLVEDEAGLRDAAADFLKGQGYSVLQASDGEEALRVANQFEGRIDLLLTDVIMPGPVSGPDLGRRLVELRPRVHVLYMSGYTENAILQQGIADPARQFLQKPFSFRVLGRKIRETLDQGRKGLAITA